LDAIYRLCHSVKSQRPVSPDSLKENQKTHKFQKLKTNSISVFFWSEDC
jgi:hypothetical protein